MVYLELVQVEVNHRANRKELSKVDMHYLRLQGIVETFQEKLAKSKHRVNELDTELWSSRDKVVRLFPQLSVGPQA